MLARELVMLEEQYRNLVDAVSTGVMTMDEAVTTLDNMVATDAEGIAWRLDLEGRFLAGRPGDQPQLADPQRFAVRTPGPWENSWPNGSDLGTPPGVPAAPVSMAPESELRRPKSRSRSTRPDLLGLLKGAGTLKRLRTPLIVVGAALAAFSLWTGGKSDTPDGTPLPVNESTEQTTVDQITAPVAEGQSGPQEQQVSENTIRETVDGLLAALGDPQTDVAGLIVNPGKGDRLLLRRAQYAGYRSVGLQLVSISVLEDGDRYQVQVGLRDGNGRDVITGEVSVLQRDGALRLADWPEFAR